MTSTPDMENEDQDGGRLRFGNRRVLEMDRSDGAGALARDWLTAWEQRQLCVAVLERAPGEEAKVFAATGEELYAMGLQDWVEGSIEWWDVMAGDEVVYQLYSFACGGVLLVDRTVEMVDNGVVDHYWDGDEALGLELERAKRRLLRDVPAESIGTLRSMHFAGD